MKTHRLEKAMSKSLVSVNWNQTMASVWKVMKDCKVRHLPVFGEDGSLVGILSDADIHRAIDPEHDGFAANSVAEDYMKAPVLTVEQDSSFTEALDTMIEKKISSLVVTKNSSIVGIITSEDFLKILRDQIKGSKEKSFKILDLFPYIQEAMRELSTAGI